jgi:DNA-directed RNA polymerase specialized sigma24 family protein
VPKLIIEDTELIEMVRSKQRAGAEALYDLYSQALFLAIIRIIPKREIAEDILEQTYLEAWHSIGFYNIRNGRLLTWMMSIARSLAREAKELYSALNTNNKSAQ